MQSFARYVGKGLTKEAQKIDFLLTEAPESNDITEQGRVNPLFTQLFGRILSQLLKTCREEKEKVVESFGNVRGFVELLFTETLPLTTKLLERLRKSFMANAQKMKTPELFIEEFVTIINYYESFLG